MQFVGYHGTSETSARNILSVGIQSEFLPTTGQLGRGFYIARMNGTLPQWGAEQATAIARRRQSQFVSIITFFTGEANNPLIHNDARRTILKIDAIRPLLHSKWNIMNAGDLRFLKKVNYDDSDKGLDLATDCRWLQMLVPPHELKYLRARRDDGQFQHPQNWHPKDAAF